MIFYVYIIAHIKYNMLYALEVMNLNTKGIMSTIPVFASVKFCTSAGRQIS